MILSKRIHHTRRRFKFPWEIAIPGGTNVHQLRTHTLSVLHAYKIPAEHITIFIEKHVEKEFRKQLPKGWYGRIVVCEGGPKLYTVLHSYYPVDSALVVLDPSILRFYQSEPNSASSHRPLGNLLSVFRLAFYHCLAKGFRLWGIAPYKRHYADHDPIQTDLRYCPRACWGCINPGSDLIVTIPGGEDYERSILMYKRDGGVIRLNTITAVTEDNPQSNEVFVHLFQQYPEVVILYTNSKGLKRIRLRELPQRHPPDYDQE